MEQQLERKQVLLTLEQSIQSQTSMFMKDLPSKIASEVIEKMSPYMERNNQDRVQLLLSQAQNISTLLGPSYSLTINGPDEANNESPVANVEREIRMINIWIEKALHRMFAMV